MEKTLTDKLHLDPKTCSRSEAATYLGVSTRTFDRIQKARAIAYVMVGRRRRYLLADLEHFLKANRSI
jgi:excisionase family DNA binding protein